MNKNYPPADLTRYCSADTRFRSRGGSASKSPPPLAQQTLRGLVHHYMPCFHRKEKKKDGENMEAGKWREGNSLPFPLPTTAAALQTTCGEGRQQ